LSGGNGVAVGFYNRVELSCAEQRFDLGTTLPGETISQRIVGLKVRLLGDAVYDQERWWPQVAVGMQYKKNQDFDFIPQLIGARDDHGIDWYANATKVWLAGHMSRTALASLTLRATKANQLGILCFGGDRNDSYRLEAEASLAAFVSDFVVTGIEYRQKPDNLSAFKEDDFASKLLIATPATLLDAHERDEPVESARFRLDLCEPIEHRQARGLAALRFAQPERPWRRPLRHLKHRAIPGSNE